MKSTIYPERPKIPYKDLPEGIKLCYENSIRIFNDVKLLVENERYNSATSQIILASEELAKSILLLKHYRNNQGISKNKTEDYFSKHRIRLEEFQQAFHESLPEMKLDEKHLPMIRGHWIFYKFDREKHSYVDWGQLGWSSPFTAEPIPVKSDRKSFEKMKVKSLITNFQQVLWNLTKNEDFQNTLKIPIVKRPTGDKIQEIIESLDSDKIPTKSEWGQFHIIVKITKTKPEINEEFRRNIEKKLLEEFPNYLIFVILKEK